MLRGSRPNEGRPDRQRSPAGKQTAASRAHPRLPLSMECRERFVHLPVELNPVAAQAFAASGRTLAGDANLSDTCCSRRRLDAGNEFREFPFEIVEIGQ
jgi:hypothetical protein